jgi:pimeloyl-ACP methyl ester carboxylesterase
MPFQNQTAPPNCPPAELRLPNNTSQGDSSLETISKPQSQAAGHKPPGLRAAIGIQSPSGWCEVDGCRIAWREISASNVAQSAQAILCLHSAGAGSREFHPLFLRPPAGSRLILVDWPGHGRSDDLATGADRNVTLDYAAIIIHALLNQLQIHKPILLGSGFGAAAAIHFATRFRDQAAGLVLCHPAGLISSSGAGSAPKGKRGLKRMLRRIEKFAPAKAGSNALLATKRQALRMEILKPAMQPALTAARKSLQESSASLRSALDSLMIPALFALSHDSLDYPLSKYIALLEPSMAWLPRHQFTVFEGAFHPIWDEPQRFGQMLTSFVQARLPVEKHTHAWLLSAVDWPTKNNNLWKCVHTECDAERVLPTGQNANQGL